MEDSKGLRVLDFSSVEMPTSPSFEHLVAQYRNTAQHNDKLFRLLTELTWKEPRLAVHRRYIEENKLGYGDAAFHAMWLRLLENASRRFGQFAHLKLGFLRAKSFRFGHLLESIGTSTFTLVRLVRSPGIRCRNHGWKL